MDSGDVECVVNMDSLRELREREAADGEEEKEGQREFAGRAGWCTTSESLPASPNDCHVQWRVLRSECRTRNAATKKHGHGRIINCRKTHHGNQAQWLSEIHGLLSEP